MTFPSISETRYHGRRPGLMVFTVPHAAEAGAFLEAFPEIAADPSLRSIWPLFETYLAIECDRGAGELAQAIAHQFTRLTDVESWVLETSYPRGIIDGGRKQEHCLRSCLPIPLLDRLRRDFLALHAQTLRSMENVYERMARVAPAPAYLLDVHTMASYCPIDASGQRRTIPVSFAWLEEYVEQYLGAQQHAYRRSIDLISADDAGQALADPGLLAACREALRREGYTTVDNQPYCASSPYLSHQHLTRVPALSLDVPKHLLSTTAEDESRCALDAIELDPERIRAMAHCLAGALEGMWRADEAAPN